MPIRRPDPNPGTPARAVLVPVTTFVGAFVILAVMAVAGVPWSSPLAVFAGQGLVLLVIASIFYGIWASMSRLFFYRCPQCGRGTNKVEHDDRSIHQFCAPCDVEWDIGLRRSDSSYD